MKLKIYSLLTIIVIALSSCNHKDLCYCDLGKTKLQVLYDWREAPDASPAGMCVFFYSTDNPGTYYRFDFDNIRGGEIELPAGKYELITYNNDTEIVRFNNTNSFSSHTAYTRDGDLLEPLYGNGIKSTVTPTDGERVCVTPDGLWGSHVFEVEVLPNSTTCIDCDCCHGHSRSDETGTDATEYQTITLYPHDMLCHYSYEVRNVKNIKHISKISASLSGMAPTLNMADESLGEEKITLPVGGKVDLATDRVVGQFLTFGHSDTDDAPHKMEFFVIMDDGSKYRIEGASNLDVTSQVVNAPDKRHVHIIIDGLDVPEPSGESDEGWDPTVDDWGVSEEELKV